MHPLSRLVGITWVAFWSIIAVVQEPPTPPVVPVVPPQPISVTATTDVQLGDPVRITVATEGKGLLVRVRHVLPGEDLDASENLLDLEGPGVYGFTSRQAGGYLVEAQSIVDDAIVTDSAPFRIGPAVPTPTPTPTPIPVPNPTPGAKWILVIQEKAEVTPAIASTVKNLRSGPVAKYISDSKHQLWILDDDVIDPDGAPSKAMAPWLKVLSDAQVKLPAIIIAEPQQGAAGVLHKGPLPSNAEAVKELLKQYGG